MVLGSTLSLCSSFLLLTGILMCSLGFQSIYELEIFLFDSSGKDVYDILVLVLFVIATLNIAGSKLNLSLP